MTTVNLVALLDGDEVGRLSRDRLGKLTFTYTEAWRASNLSIPLSLSMPLVVREHKHEAIEPFLWGLLPDNEFVLGKWAQRFQVSPRNVFGLIANVGEDCAGAAQFVVPERVEELQKQRGLRVEWLNEAAIAERLRALRQDHSAWRAPGDSGQFSLAGAQPKTALFLEGRRWGVPSGRTPTTHILKPPSDDFDGHAENEHFCLSLARALGLPSASSRVHRFGGEVAIIIERYDRIRTSTLIAGAAGASAGLKALAKTQPVLRLHQEDICQALALQPTAKYQSDGGPGPAQIIELLRSHSSNPAEDVATFVDALIFNWLVGGTDGHAKNYSLLLGSAGAVRLAPLYDLASVLPYKEFDLQRLKLAMKIGGTYRLRDIGRVNWEKLAKEASLRPDGVVERVIELASRMREQVELVRVGIANEGLKHPVLDRLAGLLTKRAQACLRATRG